MIENFKNESTEHLKARLDKIIPLITLLSRVWNNPELDAEITLTWRDESGSPRKVFINIFWECCTDTLRQFIHDYCTHLCAEKMLIEVILDQRKQNTL